MFTSVVFTVQVQDLYVKKSDRTNVKIKTVRVRTRIVVGFEYDRPCQFKNVGRDRFRYIDGWNILWWWIQLRDFFVCNSLFCIRFLLHLRTQLPKLGLLISNCSSISARKTNLLLPNPGSTPSDAPLLAYYSLPPIRDIKYGNKYYTSLLVPVPKYEVNSKYSIRITQPSTTS